MPDQSVVSLTFPQDTAITIPTGTIITFPGSPSFDLSDGTSLSVTAGSAISFPAGALIITVPHAEQSAFQLDPIGGTISFPGNASPPFPLGDLSDRGLGIAFPAETTIGFPGKPAFMAFPVAIIVKIRRKLRRLP